MRNGRARPSNQFLTVVVSAAVVVAIASVAIWYRERHDDASGGDGDSTAAKTKQQLSQQHPRNSRESTSGLGAKGPQDPAMSTTSLDRGFKNQTGSQKAPTGAETTQTQLGSSNQHKGRNVESPQDVQKEIQAAAPRKGFSDSATQDFGLVVGSSNQESSLTPALPASVAIGTSNLDSTNKFVQRKRDESTKEVKIQQKETLQGTTGVNIVKIDNPFSLKVDSRDFGEKIFNPSTSSTTSTTSTIATSTTFDHTLESPSSSMSSSSPTAHGLTTLRGLNNSSKRAPAKRSIFGSKVRQNYMNNSTPNSPTLRSIASGDDDDRVYLRSIVQNPGYY